MLESDGPKNIDNGNTKRKLRNYKQNEKTINTHKLKTRNNKKMLIDFVLVIENTRYVLGVKLAIALNRKVQDR